jgi:beta-glucanase (GH16 family)
MTRHVAPILAAAATVALLPATASAAAPTTTVVRPVAAPGTYDLSLAITAPKRDVVHIKVGKGVTRKVTVARRSRRINLRVVIDGKRVVARVVGHTVRPRVTATISRVRKRRPTTTTTTTTTSTTTTTTTTTPPPTTTTSTTTAPYVPATLPSNLVWSDEFNGTAGTGRSATGTPETGYGWGNVAEWQTYTNSTKNASLDGGGNLQIAALREPGVGAHGYTSARLTTRGKFSFTYGRLEARMKLPRGKGIWPAFWAMGDDINTAGWPANGEVDVMEALGDQMNTWQAHVHGPSKTNNNQDVPFGDGLLQPFDLGNDFHTYGIVGSPNQLQWMLDGKVYLSVTPDKVPGMRWVFDHNFHVLLSLAVGGDWPGYPDASTPFPANWLVDYVRVYQ